MTLTVPLLAAWACWALLHMAHRRPTMRSHHRDTPEPVTVRLVQRPYDWNTDERTAR